jgi:hypothetical protein
MVFSNITVSNNPVGRVNDRKPLGHSGHRRLQEVVGSIAKATGKKPFIGVLVILEKT